RIVSFLGLIAQCVAYSEFHNIRREMSEVEAIVLRVEADSKQLHRNRTDQHLDPAAVFVGAYFVDDAGLEFELVPFDVCEYQAHVIDRTGATAQGVVPRRGQRLPI